MADAKKSPFYKQLLVKFGQIPLGENPEYEKACYFRYLAMSETGGGWMSDYDTLPLHFPATGDLVSNGTFTVLQGHIPALMSGSQDEWRRDVPSACGKCCDADAENPYANTGF